MSAFSGLLILSLTVELSLFLFHLSVLVCIVRNRRRGNATFRTGFFTLYVMQSIADYVDHGFTLVLLRLAAAGYVSQEFFNFPQGNVCMFILTYGCHFQLLSHAGIAVNRFLALRNAWNEQKQRVAIAVLLVLALPAAATRLPGGYRLVERANLPGVYAVIREVDPWINMTSPFTIAGYSLSTATFSLIFEIWSLVIYKQLTASAKRKYRNDFLLLIYSLLQFLIQVVITVVFGFTAYGVINGDLQLAATARSASFYAGFAFCFSPPICLFSTSKSLRNAYFDMYFPFIRAVSSAGGTNVGVVGTNGTADVIRRNVVSVAGIKP